MKACVKAIWENDSNDGVGGNRDQGKKQQMAPFFSPQTFGELCSNVTLFICLRVPDCQIASSQGFTMGSLSSSMFQQKAILHRCSHRSNQSTHLPSNLLKTLLKRKLYSWGLTEVRTFFPKKRKNEKNKKENILNPFYSTHIPLRSAGSAFWIKSPNHSMLESMQRMLKVRLHVRYDWIPIGAGLY